MVNNLVEQLKYVGGNDEGLGGYCEALIIRINNQEKYILHRYGQYVKTIESDERYPHTGRSISKKDVICGRHEKIEFKTKREMLEAFPGIFLKNWQKSDRSCGYDIPTEKFQEAHERRYKKELV